MYQSNGVQLDMSASFSPRDRPGKIGSARAGFHEKSAALGNMNPKYYTGHRPASERQGSKSAGERADELQSEIVQDGIVGYQGHLHGVRNTFGQTFRDARHDCDLRASGKTETEKIHQVHLEEPHFGEQMEREERYKKNLDVLEKSHMSQQMLLQLVQAKLQERVTCHANQVIKVKHIFENFDKDDSGELDEWEFRRGLELLNVQLSDVQVLALFSHFDSDYSGTLAYEEFAKYAMLPNPQGGTACNPKVITMTRERNDFHHQPPM